MSNEEMTEIQSGSTPTSQPAAVPNTQPSLGTDQAPVHHDVETEEKSMQETRLPMYSEVEHQENEAVETGVRPLYRHPTHRIFGGVCGGVADYLNLDAGLVRILWLVLSIPTAGAGFLAYLVLWLLLPVGTSQSGVQEQAAIRFSGRNAQRAGMLLVGIGALWLLANVGILPWIWNAFWSVVGVVFWPALLIGAGMLLLKNQKEWRASFAQWRSQFRNGVRQQSGRVNVDRTAVKDSMRQIYQRIPLKRSRTDRLWLGVSGGMARTFRLDANLIRLFWVLFSVGTMGFGVLIYAIVGAILPEQSIEAQAADYEIAYSREPQDVQIIDGTTH